ncbi:hypothetical protein E2C01_034854 [Portunus trituberculatus]|uniref:Uncharacterized protein n=1 Tax=Portunus trituberculatus TaxID=210409 RepID=A0A5B7F7G8_PORTR|nr:hypothetical protein [Portunus trituberculatus]
MKEKNDSLLKCPMIAICAGEEVEERQKQKKSTHTIAGNHGQRLTAPFSSWIFHSVRQDASSQVSRMRHTFREPAPPPSNPDPAPAVTVLPITCPALAPLYSFLA